MYSQQQGPYPPPPPQHGFPKMEEPPPYSYLPPPPQGQYAYPQQQYYGGPQVVTVYSVPDQGQFSAPPSEPMPNNFGNSFLDASIRRAFIRKVYTVLSVQLLVTLGFICLFVFCEPVKIFVRQNPWFYYLSYAVFLVTYITLICCPGLRRRHPANLIMLSIFTLAMSYMAATISSYYDTKIVVMAIGISAACCLIVSVSAAFCKFDVTRWGWLLAIAVFILFLFAIVSMMFAFIPSLHTPWWHGIFSGLIALVFMAFLAYDTQLLLGGRKYELSPEEYITGAMQLYLDVVYIFLGILGISGAAGSN